MPASKGSRPGSQARLPSFFSRHFSNFPLSGPAQEPSTLPFPHPPPPLPLRGRWGTARSMGVRPAPPRPAPTPAPLHPNRSGASRARRAGITTMRDSPTHALRERFAQARIAARAAPLRPSRARRSRRPGSRAPRPPRVSPVIPGSQDTTAKDDGRYCAKRTAEHRRRVILNLVRNHRVDLLRGTPRSHQARRQGRPADQHHHGQ